VEVEEASMVVVVLAVVVVSTAVASVPAVSTLLALVPFMVPLWLPRILESAAAVVESALADRTSQAAFLTLPAQDPGSLHLGDRHPGNQSMKDNLIDP